MDWKEYVIPVQIKKDGSCVSFKLITQFPSDNKQYIGLYVKGVLGENAIVNFEKIKTKEVYLKDEKAWHDYVTYLQFKKNQEELEKEIESCDDFPFLPSDDYD